MSRQISGCQQFKAKFVEWRNLVWASEPAGFPTGSTLEPHCIYAQISEMMWDHAVYQIAKHVFRGKRENMIWDFIERNYFKSQALAIRRLTDENSDNEERSVISLTGLLHDLKHKAGCFTRANVFYAMGLVYGGTDLLSRELNKDFSDLIRPSGKETAPQNPDDVLPPSGKETAPQNPDDVLPTRIIEALKNRLKVCKLVRKAANKLVAHSSHPVNRGKNEDHMSALRRIKACQDAICQVASFVSVVILRYTQLHSFLFTPTIPEQTFLKDSGCEHLWNRLAARCELLAVPEWPKGFGPDKDAIAAERKNLKQHPVFR